VFCGYGSPKICQAQVYIQWGGAEEDVCVCVCVCVSVQARVCGYIRVQTTPLKFQKYIKATFEPDSFRNTRLHNIK